MATAPINVSASGDATIVAAPGVGNRIVLLGWKLMGFGDVLAVWSSAATLGNPLSYSRLKDGGGDVCPPVAGFEIALPQNTPLILNLSAAIQTVGHVAYKIQ